MADPNAQDAEKNIEIWKIKKARVSRSLAAAKLLYAVLLRARSRPERARSGFSPERGGASGAAGARRVHLPPARVSKCDPNLTHAAHSGSGAGARERNQHDFSYHAP